MIIEQGWIGDRYAIHYSNIGWVLYEQQLDGSWLAFSAVEVTE